MVSDVASSILRMCDVAEKRKCRESGLELLRIIAVVLIVAHHEVAHSDINVFDQALCAKRIFFQLLYLAPGKIGIALFLLISVWFLADKSLTIRKAFKKIWLLWRELLFWNVVSLAFRFVFGLNDDTSYSIEHACLDLFFPLTRDEWWYVTSYAIFLLLLPFILPSLKNMGRTLHGKCCLVMLLMWAALGLVPGAGNDIGLNIVGFIYIFVLVSYYKWYLPRISKKTSWIILIAGMMVIFAANIVFSLIFHDATLLIEYISPWEKEWSIPILMISFGLFELFRNIKWQSNIVNYLATSAFGVYLFTEQPFFRERLWTKYVVLSHFYDTRFAILYAVISVILVCTAAGALDLLRNFLFRLTIDRHRGAWFDALWNIASAKFHSFSHHVH